MLSQKNIVSTFTERIFNYIKQIRYYKRSSINGGVMNIKDNLLEIEKTINDFKNGLSWSLDDLRNYIQDGETDKALKEIDEIQINMEEL